MCNDHLFGALDDEVASLIIGALIELDSFFLGFVGELAPLGLDHDGQNGDFDFIEGFPLSFISVPVFEHELDGGFVVEIPEPACHGINFFILFVGADVVDRGQFVELIFELALKLSFVAPHLVQLILIFDFEGELSILSDNLSDVEGKLVERVHLLLHKAILLKVLIKDFPDMFLAHFNSLHHIFNYIY